MQADGTPVVKELNSTDLSIQQPLKGGGTFSIVCAENEVTFAGVDMHGQPLKWAFNIIGGTGLRSVVKQVNATSVIYSHSGVDYRLKLGSRAGSCRQLETGSIRLIPNGAGKLVLILDSRAIAAVPNGQDFAPGEK